MVIICTVMKNALVGLLLICWFPSSVLASSCKPGYSLIRGKVLKNHIIKTGSAERIDDCFRQCLGHSGCHSINFYQEKRLCELNDKTHASHPEDMREEPVANYMVNDDFRPMTCNKHSDCENNFVCLSTMTCGECKDRALGMENNGIPDSAITASSTNYHAFLGHEPWRARLNNVVTNSSTGSWTAGLRDESQWLQIDLRKEMVVTKIATQGRPGHEQWVKSYKISFISNGTNWDEFKENGSVKVFSGNSDRDTIVPHVLSSRILARFVRFSILSWNNHISMRVELYGCP